MIKDIKQTDLFGDKVNQGYNYEKYRPKYPQQFIDHILNKQPINNYIDFGCGTGQLLYKIAPQVKKNIIGNDISETQLEVANKLKEKFIQENQMTANLHFIKSPALDLSNEIQQEKFDVITVAQALHWMDVNGFLQMCSEQLLNQNGYLYPMGYFALGFKYNFEDETEQSNQQSQKGQAIYDAFYEVVEKYFDFDRTELAKGYITYDFKKFFKNSIQVESIEELELDTESFILYLKTFSAYNTYIKKHKDQPKFVDPIDTFRNSLNQDFAYFESKKLKLKEKNLIMRNYYFYWELSNI